ncbi:MlaD family protein [Pararhodonellum marinum]|uniref:MlaD family protein n=1 Tax=Pararhodonellum marinum TaxID=2755358 RepID=UPI00188DF93C|nr:MCE family protein [Pararhodonellum marinum]
MKDKKKLDHAKLGILVLSGTLFLVFSLYMIGRNQNIFGASITITALVDHVNGLVPGNNVRFKGMDVGTVKSIEMVSDSSIIVHLYIQKRMKPYIRNNAKTSISTDGLMGNKMLQIVPQEGMAPAIEEGDVIYALDPAGTEELLQRLDGIGEYFEKTSVNLYEITTKLNESKQVWELLSDSLLTQDIRAAVAQIRLAGTRASDMALTGKKLLDTFEEGEGLLAKVFTDSLFASQFSKSMEEILQSSQQANQILFELKGLVSKLKSGEGTAGLLLQDTVLREAVMNSMLNIEEGTDLFNENMEALRSNFLFRRHFRRLEKEQKKSGNQAQ